MCDTDTPLSVTKTYPIRLTGVANELLRNSYHYRGDLSDQLVNILSTLNLHHIQLHKIPKGRAAESVPLRERPTVYTSVRLPVNLYEKVLKIGKDRNVSVNTMLNSAILEGFAKL